MSDSILDGSGQPICSSESELAVQVTGTGHVANQLQKLAIKFYGTGDAKYSNCNEEINTAQHQIASTIFKWPEDVANSANQKQLVIEVPTTAGGKINLPVCHNLLACGSKPDNFFLANRLYSIIPIYHFGSYTDDKESRHNHYYGAARAGYIYIFLGDTLWRELLVSRDEQGINLFQDIDLANFRDNDNHYQDGQRDPSGVELKDIWVPASFHGSFGQQVRIAYSDVQWSGSRINYLQKNQRHREQRSALIIGTENSVYTQLFLNKDIVAARIQNGQTPLVSLKLLPPTRARNEAIELLIDHPAKYLITPNYLTAFQQNKSSNIDNHLNNQDANNQYGLKPHLHSGFDASAWQYNLLAKKQPYTEPQQGIQPPSTQRTIDEENIFNSLQQVWTDQTPFTDSLQQVRARGIFGILIYDPNYQVTCSKERIKLLASAFTTVCVEAQKDPNYRVASLIEKQRKLVDEFEKGITDQMSTTGRQQYDQAVAGPIRRELHRRINFYKQVLANFLGADFYQYYMADLFSNYDTPINIIGHLNYIAETLNLMSVSPASYDPLLPIEAELDSSLFTNKVPSQVVQDITTDSKNPLHRMLYPQVEFESLQKPYTPIAQAENTGDGLFNEGLWCTISNNDSLLSQEPTTLNGAAISKIKEQGEILLTTGQFPNFKVMNASLYSLIGTLADARKRAQENILQERQDYRDAQKEVQKARQELASYQHEQQKVAGSRDKKLQSLAKHQQKIANAEDKLMQIEQAYQAKLQQLGAVKARIPIKELAQLRITGGENFRNLQIKLASEVTIKGSTSSNYFVLGSIDHVPRPKANLKRKFSLFDKDVLFESTTKGRRTDVYLIVMADNDPYVQLRKRQLNEQIPELEAEIKKSNHAVAHLEGELDTLDNKHTIASRAVNKANSQVDTHLSREMQVGTLFRQTEKTINSRIYTVAQRIERTGVIPRVLLGMELINITLVIISLENNLIKRGEMRAWSGFGVAFGDTSMAAIAVLETMQNQHQLFAKHTLVAKGLDTMGQKSTMLAKFGLTKAVNRMIPLGILAVLNTALSTWDAYHAFKHGDGAFYGHIALALAGAASVMSILAGAGASVGFGPAGWIVAAVLLLTAGITLLWKFSDTELEQWFKQGPFGGYQNYPNLKQADEALAVLLNMVFQPDISIEVNHFQAQAKQRLLEPSSYELDEEQREILSKVSQANTCIILNSELMGFADTDTMIRYGIRLYQYQQDIRTDRSATYKRTYSPITQQVLHTEITPNGAIIFTHTPKATNYKTGYLWLGAIQVASEFIKAEGETPRRFYYFPAPPFTDKVQYNPTQDSHLSLTMPPIDVGHLTVSGAGELSNWAKKLEQNFWKKLLIDGNNIL